MDAGWVVEQEEGRLGDRDVPLGPIVPLGRLEPEKRGTVRFEDRPWG